MCSVQLAGVTHRSRLLCSWVLRGTEFEIKLTLVPAFVLAVTGMFSIDFCMIFMFCLVLAGVGLLWLAVACFVFGAFFFLLYRCVLHRIGFELELKPAPGVAHRSRLLCSWVLR